MALPPNVRLARNLLVGRSWREADRIEDSDAAIGHLVWPTCSGIHERFETDFRGENQMNIRDRLPAMSGHFLAFAGTALLGTALLMAQAQPQQGQPAQQAQPGAKAQTKTPAPADAKTSAPGAREAAAAAASR